jgi:hypothetical protein
MESGPGVDHPGRTGEEAVSRAQGGGMPEAKRQNERLVVLPIVGLLVLNYPLLSLCSRAELIFGVPVLYFYLFLVWFIYILCVALIVETSNPPPPPEAPKSRKMG